jgi:hypothetical protein
MKRWEKIEKYSVRVNPFQIRYTKPLYYVFYEVTDIKNNDTTSGEEIFLSKAGAVNFANKKIKFWNDIIKKKNTHLLRIKVLGVFPNDKQKEYMNLMINI